MKPLGARASRPALVSAAGLLLLAGLSCKYNVTLPWVAEDASTPVPDSAFDLPPPSAPDLPVAGPDAQASCPSNNTYDKRADRIHGQVQVAIDRSASMQKEFPGSTSKAEAAVSALRYTIDRHWIPFPTLWFPGTNCGGSVCCADTGNVPGGGKPTADASWACGAYDPGCPTTSTDSPSHAVLRQAYFKTDAWWITALVLITDQPPRCAIESPSDTSLCDQATSFARKLGDLGIQTFVVFPSSDGRTAPSCLTKIATENAHYFSEAEQLLTAQNSSDLSDRLNDIASNLEKRLCSFYVGMGFSERIVNVKINGEIVQRDDTGQNGWKVSNDQIVLSPKECIKTNTANPDVKAVICDSGKGQGGPSYGNAP